jgi:hypothetical protein
MKAIGQHLTGAGRKSADQLNLEARYMKEWGEAEDSGSGVQLEMRATHQCIGDKVSVGQHRALGQPSRS